MRPARSARSAHPVRSVRTLSCVCLALLLALAGCSDSDGDDPEETTNTTSGATATTVRPVDTSFTGQNSAEFCQLITTFTAGSQELSPAATPDELEASLSEALGAIDEAVAKAPTEIKGDVTAIAGAFKTVVDELGAVDFDISKVDSKVLLALQSDGFLDAVTRLQAYLTNVCKTPAG